ncbi:MAG: SAM-dependent methyltransferase [Ilumatobacteraceae bacterium]
MDGFDPQHSFDDEVARHYDDHLRGDEEDAATFLADLAGEGRRSSLPSAPDELLFHSLPGAFAWMARTRCRWWSTSAPSPGGLAPEVAIGDMSSTVLLHRYQLVSVVYNTTFNLLTADDQVRCFENAVHHLANDGVFVVEAAVPTAWITRENPEYVRATHVGLSQVRIDVARYDPVTQLFEKNQVELTPSGITMRPIVLRLITPGEMDSMARIAGLRLVHRYASWRRERFETASRAHISVYART